MTRPIQTLIARLLARFRPPAASPNARTPHPRTHVPQSHDPTIHDPTLHDWLQSVSPNWDWEAPHLRLLQQELQLVTEGKVDRLMLFLPPRHGKSELVTVRYPVFRLEQNPGLRVIIGAYNQSLAERFSRKARRLACSRGLLRSTLPPGLRSRSRSGASEGGRGGLRNTAADWETAPPPPDGVSHSLGQRSAEARACVGRHPAGSGSDADSIPSRPSALPAPPENTTKHDIAPTTPAAQLGTPNSELGTPNGPHLTNSPPHPSPIHAHTHTPTQSPGGVRAIGVGGGITGLGADLILIDDPVKSREEAESATYRNRVWDWYRDDLYTRQEPGCAIILVMTRWHEDDLAGRILRSEEAPRWRVVRLPALAEAESDYAAWSLGLRNENCEMRDENWAGGEVPSGGPRTASISQFSFLASQFSIPTEDPLGRPEGAPLWPQRFNEEALKRIKATLGSRSFASLYQGRPLPAEGGLFKREWFRIVDRNEPSLTSDTSDTPDPSVAPAAGQALSPQNCSPWFITLGSASGPDASLRRLLPGVVSRPR